MKRQAESVKSLNKEVLSSLHLNNFNCSVYTVTTISLMYIIILYHTHTQMLIISPSFSIFLLHLLLETILYFSWGWGGSIANPKIQYKYVSNKMPYFLKCPLIFTFPKGHMSALCPSLVHNSRLAHNRSSTISIC